MEFDNGVFFVLGVIIIPWKFVVNFNSSEQIANVFPILPSAEKSISPFFKYQTSFLAPK